MLENNLLLADWGGIPTIVLTLIIGMVLLTSTFIIVSRCDKRFTPYYIIGITVGILMAIISMNSKISVIVLAGIKHPLVLSSLFFPVLAVSTDVLNEFYGIKQAKTLLYTEIVAQLLMYILMFWLVAVPAVSAENQAAYVANYTLAWRGFIASVISMLICNLADIYIFAWFRKLTKSKQLWLRVFGSTVLSLLLDTVIYTTIVFWGISSGTDLFGMMKISILVRIICSFFEVAFLYLLKWLELKQIFLVEKNLFEKQQNY
jgi:uncharacterized integral membrane protein (TIGR00697 family)